MSEALVQKKNCLSTEYPQQHLNPDGTVPHQKKKKKRVWRATHHSSNSER